MKKTYLLCCKLALTLFFLFTSFLSFSQTRQINVVGVRSNITIISGTAVTSTLNNTNFGANTTGIFRITNTALNSGTDTNKRLTISNITLSGTNAAEFSISSATSGTVRPAGEGNPQLLDIVIDFLPTSAGVKNATVTISSNSALYSSFTFAISATATVLTTGPGGVTSNLQLWLRAD